MTARSSVSAICWKYSNGAVFGVGDMLEVLEHVLHHLLRQVGATTLGQTVEDGTTGLLVVVLQDFRVQVVLFRDVIDDAVVIDFTVQDFRELLGNDRTFAAVVSGDVDNDFLCHSVTPLVWQVFFI